MSVSKSSFAGIAMLPFSSDSTLSEVDIVVSRSDAEIIRSLSDISNKILSRIGSVLLELITPLIV